MLSEMELLTIGIDPGPTEHGVVWFTGRKVVRAENLTTDQLVSAVSDNLFYLFACEMVTCFGMPVGREVFETVLQIGRLQQSLEGMRLIPRLDIKMHVCGNAGAKDPNVRQALIDKLGPVGTKRSPGPCYGISNHLWAALAVAVTAFEVEQTKHEWARKAS